MILKDTFLSKHTHIDICCLVNETGTFKMWERKFDSCELYKENEFSLYIQDRHFYLFGKGHLTPKFGYKLDNKDITLSMLEGDLKEILKTYAIYDNRAFH